MSNNYLFYISENYCFEILRPLQTEILARGDRCAWFVEGEAVNRNNFRGCENQLTTVQQLKAYNPVAVFVPGNIVPSFIPGLKVQVFHGLEWKKKGHFRMRGCFDLYCTHGEITTLRFMAMAKKYGYFTVKETGWPKLDPLFKTLPFQLNTQLPVVLFAPTFSPNLTCALECYEEIKRLSKKDNYYWIVKFHPKMNREWIEMYRKLESENFEIIDADSCLPLLQRADVLLSDTSSIISEFLLLNKPAVTFKNSRPGEYLIDVTTPVELEGALQKALEGSVELIKEIKSENLKLHPYQDGLSSKRMIEEVDRVVENSPQLKRKLPLNLLRQLKLRVKLNYWQL